MKVTDPGMIISSMFDDLTEGCQIIDFGWKFVYLNDAACKQRQKPKQELLNHSLFEVFPGMEKTDYFKALQKCMINRIPSNIRNLFNLPDGTAGWFDLGIEPVPQGVFILSNDITALVQGNEEIQNQIKKLKALHEIDQSILGSTDLNIALKTILREVTAQLNVDAAAVRLLNQSTRKLEYAIGMGFRSDAFEKIYLPLDGSLTGLAALEHKPARIMDLDAKDIKLIHPDAFKTEGFKSYLAYPLIAKGELHGVLEIFLRSLLQPNQAWLDYLEEIAGQASIAVDNYSLFKNLHRANTDLLLAYDANIEGWSRALDLRDKESEGHSLRVTEMTVALARRCEYSETEITHLRYGALLHDIGKMGVPDAILLKPDKLTDEEFAIMQKHAVYAYELLSPIKYLHPSLDIPYCHHEKWDGTGYPRKLKGEQIPFPARLFSVVDVWDALRSDRPYREGWPKKKAFEHSSSLSGKHFDPQVVKLFIELLKTNRTLKN